MRTIAIRLLFLAALSLTIAASAACAAVIQVTDTPYGETAVRVSGDWIVFVGGGGTGTWPNDEEIYIQQLSTGVATRLTNDGVRQYLASISGDRVVWTDYRWVTVGWDCDVFGYDISSSLLGPVAAVGAAQWSPAISGDRAVWCSDHVDHVLLYTEDPVTHVQGQVFYTPGQQSSPQVDGERLVWEDQSSDDGDILLYDFGTATMTPVCIATAAQITPDIDGDIVVWTDYRSGNPTIWFYNLLTSATGPVSPQPTAAQYYPRVSGTRIVWQASGGIFLYDLATDRLRYLSLGQAWAGYPDIDGDTILWQYYSEGLWHIYRYVNLPPELATIGDQIVSEGGTLTFTVAASEPDEDPITLSASNLPAGATFDPVTGEFSWTPGYDAAGTYPAVHFEVTDGELTDSEDITITVLNTDRAPVLDPIGNKVVDEGQLLSFAISGTDPDSDAFTYSASNLPPGAGFDAVSRTFNWTPTFSQTGNYPGVRFEVTDGELSDSEEITISVGDVNRPPVLDSIGNKTVAEGALLSFTVSGSDPDDDALTYSASNLPAGALFDPETRQFAWTPLIGQAGTYPGVELTVSDGDLSDSEQITITVTGLSRIEVGIDIKPGSSRNPVNPKSQGVLPVAVFSSEIFDATDIDPGTVYLAGAPVAQNPDDGKWMIEEKDENGDGLMDVRLFFDTEQIDTNLLVDEMAIMTGSTFGSLDFQGSDHVTIVPKDLANDFWALEEIAECMEGGVALGYPDGLYRPEKSVSRDQMAVFVSRACAGSDDAIPEGPTDQTFSDVPADQWAYDAIEYAVGNEIVTGYGDGSYQPSWIVTRGQMAVYIARAKGWVSVDDDMTTAGAVFPDVPSGYWSGAAIQACVSNGVVQGHTDGYYRPAVEVTRDQMAVYIARGWELPR